VADTDALLREIQSGRKLRKVDRSASSGSGGSGPAAARSPVSSGSGNLMDALKAQLAAVRIGVDGEKEEADEEWTE